MKHLTSQILERNTECFGDDLLVISPPDHDTPTIFGNATLLCFDYRSFQSFKERMDERVCFGLDELPDKRYQQVLVYMPKSKAELSFLLDLGRSRLKDEGELFLVGGKKAGINSGAKLLSEKAPNSSKLDSAKHCQLWSGHPAKTGASFDLSSYFVVGKVELKGQSLEIASLPGVFNAGRLDEGTAFLLEQDLKRLKGRTLDFGCGAGIISCFLKRNHPEIEVEAIDSSWLALKSTEESLRRNSLVAKVYASDGWSEVVGRVNGIVTNPPFHQGVSTEYETTENFIRVAHSKMAKYAPMYMVANNFLNYPSLIESVFGQCKYLAQSNKYNVYYCER